MIWLCCASWVRDICRRRGDYPSLGKPPCCFFQAACWGHGKAMYVLAKCIDKKFEDLKVDPARSTPPGRSGWFRLLPA